MSKLVKKLRALASGRELPWHQIVALIESFGGKVVSPRGGGSHYRIHFSGHSPITVPVHNGKIKRIYAEQIANILEEVDG